MTQAADQLEKQVFQCEADAQAVVDGFQARPEHPWFQIVPPTVSSRVERIPGGRGRPRKDAPTRIVWTVSASVGAVDADRRQAELERRSCFGLMTTLPATWDARAVLVEYKSQTVCARKCHFMKDPMFVDALFLKTPERLDALGYVILMAALFYSLLERRHGEARCPFRPRPAAS